MKNLLAGLMSLLLANSALAADATLIVEKNYGGWYAGGAASMSFYAWCIDKNNNEKKLLTAYGAKNICKDEKLKYSITFSGPRHSGTAKNCEGILKPGETKHLALVGSLQVWPECKIIG